jgi:hypothetical protein
MTVQELIENLEYLKEEYGADTEIVDLEDYDEDDQEPSSDKKVIVIS